MGVKSTKGGSFPTFYLIFHKFSHGIERICVQMGVLLQTNPRTPSKSVTLILLHSFYRLRVAFTAIWAQLFKTNDVVSKRFVKISNINITNTLLFFVEKM